MITCKPIVRERERDGGREGETEQLKKRTQAGTTLLETISDRVT